MTGKAAADHVIELYERHAKAWDAARGRNFVEQAWIDRFTAPLPPGAAILDLGCGSGEPVARYLVERGHAVTGIDTAPTMIRMCRERFPTQKWIVADMRELNLGRCFEGIIAWDSLFHLSPDDQRRMFPVLRDHAAPEAILLFTSGPAHGENVGTWQGAALYHGSLGPAEYRRLLNRNGFSVLSHVGEDSDCGGHTVWLARRTSREARRPRAR